jgi:hypothetical protein
MKLTYLLLAAFLLAALPSRADSLYEVTGTATLTGNNVCGGPCIETIDFTFDFDEGLAAGGYGTLYTLTLVGQSNALSGPLNLSPVAGGPVTAEPGAGGPATNYLAFFSSSGIPIDEIDVWVSENLEPLPFIPGITGMDLYACNSAACIPDFCPSFYPCRSSPLNTGIFLRGTVTSQTKLINTPEPSELGLMALGAALLGFSALCGWIPGRKSAYERNLRSLAPALDGTSLE